MRAAQRRRRTVLVGAGLFALSGPGQTAGFSVFVNPVTAAFGISRGELTAIYLLATLGAAPAGFWLGQYLDRLRVSTMVRVVSTGLAAALVLVAASSGVVVLGVGIFGLRAFGQSGLTLTSSVFVARSITERRGAALGLLSALGGFAITLTPLVASRLIPGIGWRWTWFLLAGVVLAGGWLISFTTVVAKGANAPPAASAEHLPTAEEVLDAEGTAANARQRRWAFVVVAGGFASTAAISTALAFHQIAVLGERGLSPTAAATNFLPQSIAAASTAIVAGRLVDRVPGRIVVPFNMALLIAALASLRLVSSPATAVLFGLLLGCAAAANGATEGALLARWSGTARLGRLRGRLMALVVASTAIAPMLFSLLADAVGSFTRAATVVMVLPLCVGAMTLAAPLPAEHRPSTRLS